MRVKLAGYNLPIENLQTANNPTEEILTPEIFSAAYARISRSPKSITQLRQEAARDIINARKSNQKIIFAMGHHSVAEHAVFNFDLENISRLALEEVEKFRLNSYTEKSQRYVKLQKDFYLPEEFSAEDQKLFLETIEEQNNFYHSTLEKISSFLKSSAANSSIEERAKEDSRFALSLATYSQAGMTINARNLEHMLRRLACHPLKEISRLINELYQQTINVAPSLILFATPSEFEKDLFQNRSFLQTITRKKKLSSHPPEFKLLSCTQYSDALIAAAFFSSESDFNYSRYVSFLKKSAKQLSAFYYELFKNLEFFDRPPREFEMAELVFQANVSASCYAQLKRHRLLTLIVSPYSPELGVTIPPVFNEAGCLKQFKKLIHKTNQTYRILKSKYEQNADYILTNAHRRTVLVKMNFRELYHFIRLRADSHAQWEIRNLAQRIAREIKKHAPYSALLLCGKSDFEKDFEKIYKRKPSTPVPR